MFLEKQTQNIVFIIQKMYSSELNLFDRFRRLNIITIIIVWITLWLVYVLSDKIERCISAVCAKCRGDGEFEYDSEEDEDELSVIEENTQCHRC